MRVTQSCAVWLALLALAALKSECTAFVSPAHALVSSVRVLPSSFSAPCRPSKAMSMTLNRRDALGLLAGGASVLSSAPAVIAADEANDGGAWARHEFAFKDSEFADFKVTPSGLKYKDVVEGSGEQPKEGETVRAHYAGYLLDGTLFDTSYRPALFPFSLISPSGPPQAFKLEKGALIPGFQEGMLGMKVGGKRIVFVDPKLGYGERGAGSVIPPNSVLVFFLELRSIGSKISL